MRLASRKRILRKKKYQEGIRNKKRYFSISDILQLMMALIALGTVMLSYYQMKQTQELITYTKKSDDVNRKLEYFSNFLPTFEFQTREFQRGTLDGENRLFTCVSVTNKSDKPTTNIEYQNNYLTFQQQKNQVIEIFDSNVKSSGTLIESKLSTNCSNPNLFSGYTKDSLLQGEEFYFLFSIPENRVEEVRGKEIYNHLYFYDKLGIKYAVLLEFYISNENYINIFTKTGQATYYFDVKWKLTSDTTFANNKDLYPRE